jgi:hypothetical protein
MFGTQIQSFVSRGQMTLRPLLPIVILIKGVGRSLQNDPRHTLLRAEFTSKGMSVIERGH